jgi:hypothetical protein
MGRIVFELVVLAAIAVAILTFARQWDDQRRLRGSGNTGNAALAVPADAVWAAMNQGTSDGQTEIVVVLRSPGSTTAWDRRVCDVIPNRDPNYDKRLYNAMEDARSRANLLNTMRDG